jgi:hypothetical protein
LRFAVRLSAEQAGPETARAVSFYLLQYKSIVFVADSLERDMALTPLGLFEKRVISRPQYQRRIPGYTILQIFYWVSH